MKALSLLYFTPIIFFLYFFSTRYSGIWFYQYHSDTHMWKKPNSEILHQSVILLKCYETATTTPQREIKDTEIEFQKTMVTCTFNPQYKLV